MIGARMKKGDAYGEAGFFVFLSAGRRNFNQ
jgi:hypothetical protein